VLSQGTDLNASCYLPEPDNAVIAGGHKQAAIGRKRRAVDRIWMLKLLSTGSVSDNPDRNGAFLIADGSHCPISRKGNAE